MWSINGGQISSLCALCVWVCRPWWQHTPPPSTTLVFKAQASRSRSVTGSETSPWWEMGDRFLRGKYKRGMSHIRTALKWLTFILKAPPDRFSSVTFYSAQAPWSEVSYCSFRCFQSTAKDSLIHCSSNSKHWCWWEEQGAREITKMSSSNNTPPVDALCSPSGCYNHEKNIKNQNPDWDLYFDTTC